MRGITVCVDYADILAITLDYNRHHFDEFWVVTKPTDIDTITVAMENHCNVFKTEAFYDDGAIFNKFKALEQGLEAMNLKREGEWLAIIDADICWPMIISHNYMKGFLYTPLRRMMEKIVTPIPSERDWNRYPLHQQQIEWAGYTQIFHTSDPVLGKLPWHETNWRHAGGADSFFQMKWKPENKVRPNWEVLHLGEAGINWCGRATTMLDGTTPEEAEERKKKLHEFKMLRVPGTKDVRFKHERL